MRGNPGLDLAYTCERAVPSQLQFRRDQPVLRIDGVVLAECPIGAVARRLEVAHQRITNLIAAAGRLCFGLDCRSSRSRFDNPQKSFLDGVVDTQSSECDAAGLAIVERTPPTGIARNDGAVIAGFVARKTRTTTRRRGSFRAIVRYRKVARLRSAVASRESCYDSRRQPAPPLNQPDRPGLLPARVASRATASPSRKHRRS